MATVEVITASDKAKIPRINDSEELVLGLKYVVGTAVKQEFNDVAWMYFYSKEARATLASDPAFLRALAQLGLTNPDFDDDKARANVFPRPDNLATVMASQPGLGGFFHRVTDLDERKYVAAPASLVTQAGKETGEVAVDLSNAIIFEGKSLVTAMFNEAVTAEVIDYRPEPAFPAFREATIGSYLLTQTS